MGLLVGLPLMLLRMILVILRLILPILLITAAEGPIKRILHFSQSSANLAFSDKNPKPG